MRARCRAGGVLPDGAEAGGGRAQPGSVLRDGAAGPAGRSRAGVSLCGGGGGMRMSREPSGANRRVRRLIRRLARAAGASELIGAASGLPPPRFCRLVARGAGSGAGLSRRRRSGPAPLAMLRAAASARRRCACASPRPRVARAL